MFRTSFILVLAGCVLLTSVLTRMHFVGSPGMKTTVISVLGVVCLIAAFVVRRRETGADVTPATPMGTAGTAGSAGVR